MNRERLEQIRQDLIDLRDGKIKGVKLDMEIWSSGNHSCGTICCAIGLHVYCHPESPLKLVPMTNHSFIFYPKIEDFTDFTAIAVYLDITKKQAERLFSHNSYLIRDNPQLVIDNITECLYEPPH